MTVTNPYPATLTVEQAGQILGLCRSSAYRAAAKGELPTLRFGRRLIVPTGRLLSMLGMTLPDVDVERSRG
ncbi:MAG: helix-turn-helix domain-containing protein [Actinomycetota bacterium]|nr:helix-turn-helix domain-containing protein [Actinomycetota bacterium]